MKGNNITNKMLYELIASLNAEVISLKQQLKKSSSNNTHSKLFYSYAEVAQILCISVEGVRSKVRRNELERTCNNNTPLISRESLNNYFKKQNPNYENLF